MGLNLLLGELGHGLGALRHGVLGELSGEDQADGGLHLAGGQGGLGVVAGQVAGLLAHAAEDVVDEGVHDGHTGLADASVGVHLLEDAVDVGGVGLHTALVALVSGVLDALALLGHGSSGLLARHDEEVLRWGKEEKEKKNFEKGCCSFQWFRKNEVGCAQSEPRVGGGGGGGGGADSCA